jgi:hypothetical protein
MKKLLLIVLFFGVIRTASQEKIGRPFFTGSLNFTLERNEFDESFGDDEPFFTFSATLIRLGFGYEFKKRIAVSFNAGYDYHSRYAIRAFPAYGSLKLNITEFEDNTLFTELNFGKMWRPSNIYSDGNYFGLGIGTQFAGNKRWNGILRLDFHRKGIRGFKNNRLDSVSFGIGFSFF